MNAKGNSQICGQMPNIVSLQLQFGTAPKPSISTNLHILPEMFSFYNGSAIEPNNLTDLLQLPTNMNKCSSWIFLRVLGMAF